MIIKIKRFTKKAKIPTQASNGSVGYDMYVDSDKEITVFPHETVMIKSGVGMEIPEGYGGFIFPRSGLSTKKGLRLSNCVGVIDSDYRGEIGLPIHNDSEFARIIKPYDRVAQIVIQKCEDVCFMEVDDLSTTERADGGFGHSGR